MRVVVYDQDKNRNNEVRAHLAHHDIYSHAAWCLRELFPHIEQPSLKVLCVEKSCVLHYNLDIDELLDRMGYAFLVAVYTKDADYFTFSFHYIPCYLQQPFTIKEDQKMIKYVCKCLKRLEKPQPKKMAVAQTDTPHSQSNGYDQLKNHIGMFSKTQKKLLTVLLEQQNGISDQDLIHILNVENKKNKQNYLHSCIYRLRTKLQLIVANKYMIAYKHHKYYLTRI